MLLNFQVANWACFRDPLNFTMEAGPERDAGGHLVKIGAKSRPLKVLPVAAVYGNNASGKSQFIAALSFLRSLVIEEFKTGRLPLAPFLLDDTLAKEPTHFVIQFVVGDSVYELDVLLTDSEIRRETLSRYNSRNTDKTAIYVPEGQKVVSCTWGGDAYCQYVKTMNVDPTRLFLTLSAIFAAGKDELIASVYNWFSRSLVIITPGSHYIGVDDYCTEGRIADRTLDYLARFDTGIGRRDEMWVTDKAPDGSATLADFASFEGLRKGTKIRDIYLDGRLGGIPRHIGELGAVIKEVAYANA